MQRLFRGLVLLAAWPAAVLAQSPAGVEFQVNTYTTSLQYGAAVASDANGDFVVVWESLGQDGDNFGIFGQRFDASGAPRGGEFPINTYWTDGQNHPSVASDASGNFVVVWESYSQDGSGVGIFGRRFDALGVPQAAEFRVNSYTTFNQESPSVASDAAGNFVVVWEDTTAQDGSGSGVFGQRFDPAGIPQGGQFLVNSYTTGDQILPAVARDPGGRFLVTWTSSQEGSRDVFGQRFDAGGAPQGAEFRINSSTNGAQYHAAVSADASGNFIVVWWTLPIAGSLDVAGQRLDASGAAVGSEFQVNSYVLGNQYAARVAAAADGAFVVVWSSFSQDGSVSGAFAQRFDASGAPQGGEFRVNSYTTGDQLQPAVAADPDGDFVVVWNGDGQDGSLTGILGQRYGDLIFKDGFDSGGLGRWSSASTGGGNLSVTGAAALNGTSLGLQAVVDDTTALFVQDDRPSAENRYRARFYLDTDGFDPGEAGGHFRMRPFLAQGGGVRLVAIVLKRQASAYSMEARVRRDDGSRADTGFFPITDGVHSVEFDWRRATAPGANDGSLTLWIDGASVSALTGIDNDLGGVDLARLGAIAIKPGASGTLFFDQFESRRQVFIGPD